MARGGRAAEPEVSFRAAYEEPGTAAAEGDDPGGFFVFETGAGSWS